MARNIKLVRDGRARIRQAPPQRLAGLRPELRDLGLQFFDAVLQRENAARFSFAFAFAQALRAERLRTLGTITVDGHTLQPHLPGLHVGIPDVLDGAFIGHVDGLGNGAADKRLRGRHHFQMRQVREAPLPAAGLEGAVKDRQVFGAQPARDGLRAFHDIFNRMVLRDMANDPFGFRGVVSQALQRFRHRAVDDVQAPAARQQLEFYQRQFRLDARRITVHREGNGAGRRQDRHLRIAIARRAAAGQRLGPGLARFFLEIIKLPARLDFFDRVAMLLDDREHGVHIVRCQRRRHVRAAGVVITLERAHNGGNFGRLLIRPPGHDGRKGARQRAPLVRVIGQPIAHDEGAQVGVAQAERAKDMGILRNLPGRIARVINQDFLRGDKNPHGGLEGRDIENPVRALELHQVQRSEIAGRVIDENVFRAGIGGMDRLGAFAGVPLLNGPVVLQPRVTADPGALGDLLQQQAGVLFLQRLAGGDAARPPFPPRFGGFHERVADAHGKILILVHHAAVSVAIVGPVISLLN